jgi:hypothetical protein
MQPVVTDSGFIGGKAELDGGILRRAARFVQKRRRLLRGSFSSFEL